MISARPLWTNLTAVPHGRERWATPIVPGFSTWPQAVLLPERPGPYQVAPAVRQAPKERPPSIGPVEAIGEAPPVIAPAGAAADVSVAQNTTAPIPRLRR